MKLKLNDDSYNTDRLESKIAAHVTTYWISNYDFGFVQDEDEDEGKSTSEHAKCADIKRNELFRYLIYSKLTGQRLEISFTIAYEQDIKNFVQRQQAKIEALKASGVWDELEIEL